MDASHLADSESQGTGQKVSRELRKLTEKEREKHVGLVNQARGPERQRKNERERERERLIMPPVIGDWSNTGS